MSNPNSSTSFDRRRVVILLSILLTSLFAGTCVAQEQQEPLPRVVRSSVPDYPLSARQIHVQGVVRLRLTTDGEQVSGIEVLSGPPTLAAGAKKNVTTWRFLQHKPTSFEVTFRYKFLDDTECTKYPDALNLNLAAEIEVVAQIYRMCAPKVDPTKPPVIALTVKLNGKPVAAPVEVTLTSGDHSVRIPIRDGRFQVPPEFLELPTFGVLMVVGRDRIQIKGSNDGEFASLAWELVLADRRFSALYDSNRSIKWARSTCVLDYQSEYFDDVALTVPNCRSKIKN